MISVRPFASRAVFLAGAIAPLMIALGVGACSHKYSGDSYATDAGGTPTDLLAPRPPDAGMGFARARYPLAVGNRWDYRVRSTSQLISDAGPQPPRTFVEVRRVEIIGTEHIGEYEYFVRKVSYPESGTSYAVYDYLRQDRSGLFQHPSAAYAGAPDAGLVGGRLARLLGECVDGTILDPGRREAFQRAAASLVAKVEAARLMAADGPVVAQGAEPGETTELRFPLFVGARWFLAEGYLDVRSVVGRERVQIPLGVFPAWKLRETSEALGPAYRANLWYGSVGWLHERGHDEIEATDTSGHAVGRLLLDSDVSLTAIHLEDRAATAGLAAGN